jgi:hypothetical protein
MGQQVVQLHDRCMVMMMTEFNFPFLSSVLVRLAAVTGKYFRYEESYFFLSPKLSRFKRSVFRDCFILNIKVPRFFETSVVIFLPSCTIWYFKYKIGEIFQVNLNYMFVYFENLTCV